MNPFGDNSADQQSIDLEAAAWVIKRDRGLTAAEQDGYFQWLAADPRHGEWMARHQQTWQEFNLLAQWKPEHSPEPNPDLLARHRRAAVRYVWFGALAAAACLTLALYVWAPWRSATPPPDSLTATITASGYGRRVLPDGSVVELNRGARMEIAYTPAERHVNLLQGEASFTVAKNKQRPFVVRAAGVDVRAVGTAFNVRLDDRQVEVLVTEGRVQVNDASRGQSLLKPVSRGTIPVLEAGHMVVVAALPVSPVPPVAVTPGETAHLLAWQPQLLDFNSTPLAEVVTNFNRRNTVQIVIGDAELRDMPIVASFRSDNVDGFVRLLELTSAVHAERNGDTITLHKAR
ncbi:MAG: FecR family protein [Opitutales bacterium]